ncbi:acyltransferase [Fibrobacter succinogenes]|uniref:acyltransferase n=1 Tax=Fibrobacter succinogenes TaxID=833 RepID=UPI001C630C7A|nr:acyltransferase [Fibrobacter succinogenes]
MKLITFFFRIIRKGLRKIKNIYFYAKTLILFSLLGVEKKSFRTKGTPIVDISKGHIKIGDKFRMNNGNLANAIGFSTPCVLRVENANLTIGDNVGISQTTIIAIGADITIGNYVLMGGGVKIYSTDFHSLNYKNRRDTSEDRTYRKSLPVHIGDDVFIGAGSVILKGVSIGNRSIVGAGSVVTKNIPPDEIWAGNPAKFVRKIHV